MQRIAIDLWHVPERSDGRGGKQRLLATPTPFVPQGVPHVSTFVSGSLDTSFSSGVGQGRGAILVFALQVANRYSR